MPIRLTSLVGMDKIQNKCSFRMWLVGLISMKTKEYFFGCHLWNRSMYLLAFLKNNSEPWWKPSLLRLSDYLQISKKDEFRSKVQHLVAKFEELKSDAQKMETEQTHVEAASIDQEEQRANESTELLAETNGNSHEDAPIEIPEQDTNEATVSQADDQAFVLEARPPIRIPDVVLEAQTRRAPLLPSDSMTMRFHVRNFEGHNDFIYGVAC